jgi:hypothetical protein
VQKWLQNATSNTGNKYLSNENFRVQEPAKVQALCSCKLSGGELKWKENIPKDFSSLKDFEVASINDY